MHLGVDMETGTQLERAMFYFWVEVAGSCFWVLITWDVLPRLALVLLENEASCCLGGWESNLRLNQSQA